MSLVADHNRPLEEEIEALDRLDAVREEVARRMVEVTLAEVPEYAAAKTEERQAEMVLHAEQTLAMLSSARRVGARFAGAELEFVRENAVLRAEQGFPLEAILHAYRMGQRVIAGFDPALAPATVELLNAISTALTEAYVRRRHEIETDRERDRADLLGALLTGGAMMSQAERMHAAELGISGAPGLLVVVISGSDIGREPLRRCTAELERAMSPAPVLGAVRAREAVAIVALHGVSRTRIRSSVEAVLRRVPTGKGSPLRAGISAIVDHTDDLPRAHRDARRALGHAAPTGGVRALADVPLVDLLLADATSELAAESARRWPNRLAAADQPKGQLLLTLRAYLECDLSVVRTAAALGVHTNTVHYRLRRLRELTGLDPRRFNDAVELMLGSRLALAPDSDQTG